MCSSFTKKKFYFSIKTICLNDLLPSSIHDFQASSKWIISRVFFSIHRQMSLVSCGAFLIQLNYIRYEIVNETHARHHRAHEFMSTGCRLSYQQQQQCTIDNLNWNWLFDGKPRIISRVFVGVNSRQLAPCSFFSSTETLNLSVNSIFLFIERISIVFIDLVAYKKNAYATPP